MIRRLAFIPILTVIGLTWGAGLAAAEETLAQLMGWDGYCRPAGERGLPGFSFLPEGVW